jgi:hypothetical protein
MMTYQKLYESVNTSSAKWLADRMRYLYGFETEAEADDIEAIHAAEHEAMGGC